MIRLNKPANGLRVMAPISGWEPRSNGLRQKEWPMSRGYIDQDTEMPVEATAIPDLLFERGLYWATGRSGRAQMVQARGAQGTRSLRFCSAARSQSKSRTRRSHAPTAMRAARSAHAEIVLRSKALCPGAEPCAARSFAEAGATSRRKVVPPYNPCLRECGAGPQAGSLAQGPRFEMARRGRCVCRNFAARRRIGLSR